MKAALITSFGAPIEIQERAISEPGSGQVLIPMEAGTAEDLSGGGPACLVFDFVYAPVAIA